MIRFIKSTSKHVKKMRDSLRESDRQEVWAAAHMDVGVALEDAYKASSFCRTIMVDGEPVAMFGVCPIKSLLKNMGSPWMLGTDNMVKASGVIAKRSKKYIAQMQEGYDYLENYVDSRNKVSLRWLKWCGFTIEEAMPWGRSRIPFHRFWRKDV